MLLHANEAVSRDRLIDAPWGELPPPSASESLDAYIYRLRKLVGRDRLARHGSGYLLSVEAASSTPTASSSWLPVHAQRPTPVTAGTPNGC